MSKATNTKTPNGTAGIGDVVFSTPFEPELKAIGLGSCIALCAYDPKTKQACMAHVALPESPSPRPDYPGRYADTAVEYIINQMHYKGTPKSRLKIAIIGGAWSGTLGGLPNLGERNTVAVKEHLSALKLYISAEDTGGNTDRTITLDATTGTIYVRKKAGPTRVLAVLS